MLTLDDIVSGGEIYQMLQSTSLFGGGIDASNSGGRGTDVSSCNGKPRL
jgi:hypothetical protein